MKELFNSEFTPQKDYEDSHWFIRRKEFTQEFPLESELILMKICLVVCELEVVLRRSQYEGLWDSVVQGRAV